MFFLWEDGPVITLTQVLILVITAVVLTGLLWLVNKTKLGRAMIKKLKVYAGDKHPHAAQQPAELKL